MGIRLKICMVVTFLEEMDCPKQTRPRALGKVKHTCLGNATGSCTAYKENRGVEHPPEKTCRQTLVMTIHEDDGRIVGGWERLHPHAAHATHTIHAATATTGHGGVLFRQFGDHGFRGDH